MFLGTLGKTDRPTTHTPKHFGLVLIYTGETDSKTASPIAFGFLNF